jgi:hypothetical protein
LEGEVTGRERFDILELNKADIEDDKEENGRNDELLVCDGVIFIDVDVLRVVGDEGVDDEEKEED